MVACLAVDPGATLMITGKARTGQIYCLGKAHALCVDLL